MQFKLALLGLATLAGLVSTSPINMRRQIEQCEDGVDSRGASDHEGVLYRCRRLHP